MRRALGTWAGSVQGIPGNRIPGEQDGQGGDKGWPWECPGLLSKMSLWFCLFTGETPMPS